MVTKMDMVAESALNTFWAEMDRRGLQTLEDMRELMCELFPPVTPEELKTWLRADVLQMPNAH